MTFEKFWSKIKPCYKCGYVKYIVHTSESTSPRATLECDNCIGVKIASSNANLSKQLDYMLKAWNKMYEENTSKLGRYLNGTEDEP